MIAYAKAQPDTLNYGSVGIGSSQHLAGAYFEQVTGIKIVHVPYRNIAQYDRDLISGAVPLGFQWLPNVLAALNSGGAIALAVATQEPHAGAARSSHRGGGGLPDYEVSGWFVMLAPRGTPRADRRQAQRGAQRRARRRRRAREVHRAGRRADHHEPR